MMEADPPPAPPFDTEIARHVWQTRYRAGADETSIEASWCRVAHALAQAERVDSVAWERRFLDILRDFQFLPGGRIQAGAGTGRDVTLFNCFVMGEIEDSIPGIFSALREGAVTMQRGGGVGYDFSTLRPAGTRARTTGAIASGPVSFMEVWDAMCATLQSTGTRRGAMMATLRCDHPDIIAFIEAKQHPGRLLHFNLSVQITDAFMQAVAQNEPWPLVFPAHALGTGALSQDGATLLRGWPGHAAPVHCRIVRELPARELWNRLLRASYEGGEPGLLFIDRINRQNNLWYCERIGATNPCGEVPLPAYGACDLGSINLARLIRDPFTPQARLDTDRLTSLATTAVRLLDNVIDLSHFPLPRQRKAAGRARRVGLGITGLADALVMLGLPYGSDASLAFAADTMRSICHAAYRQSIATAEEKGPFPAFNRSRYLQAPFIRSLPADIRDGIARHGIRNSHLLAIAPAGSISLLAGNVSSGIEPIFAADQQRSVLDAEGKPILFRLVDYAVRLWRTRQNRTDGVPDWLKSAAELPAEAHLAMPAAMQPFVDNAIAKTINIPAETRFADFEPLYRLAYNQGLKGCTVFRPGTKRGAVLAALPHGVPAGTCAEDCE